MRSRFREASHCDLFPLLVGLIKGVGGSGYFGGGIRIASQHPAVLESLGRCGNDAIFLLKESGYKCLLIYFG